MVTKNMRWFVLVLALLVSASCQEDAYFDVADLAQGDVFIKSVQKGDEVKFAVVYYAYSASPMKKVEGYHEASKAKNFILDTIDGRFTFAYLPTESEYIGNIPASGKYWFSIEFMDGNSALVFDELSESIIQPPFIESVSYQRETEKLFVAWEKNSAVDNYKLMLVGSNNTILFDSDLLPSTQNSLSISKTNKNWEIQLGLESVDSLRLVLQAFQFEQSKSSLNLQCMAVNDNIKVAWGK
jgi:hypothetical protein